MKRMFDLLTEHVSDGGSTVSTVNLSWANCRAFEVSVHPEVRSHFEIVAATKEAPNPSFTEPTFSLAVRRIGTGARARFAAIVVCETDEASEQAALESAWPADLLVIDPPPAPVEDDFGAHTTAGSV